MGMNNTKKLLWKFYWDCDSMGEVKGLFTATAGEIEDAIGKTVEFGEILGKHSDISGELERSDLVLVTDDQEDIKTIERIGKKYDYDFLNQGYNPLRYIH